MERVAVTGGAGFIGKHVCWELYKRDIETVVIDSSTGGDVLDPDLADLLAGCQGVIHLAGILGTAELFDEPTRAAHVNVVGTANVLSACHKVGAGYVGITMPQVWDSLYQATKAGASAIARSYRIHMGVPVSHVRAFNAYGKGQKVGSPQKIIPTFADHAYRREPIPVWGSGKQLVDLVHARDVARMLVSALSFGDLEVFDAGTGVGVSVEEVALFVNQVAGSDAGIAYLPMRAGEHPDTKVVAKAEGWELLDWRPGFSWSHVAEVVETYKP